MFADCFFLARIFTFVGFSPRGGRGGFGDRGGRGGFRGGRGEWVFLPFVPTKEKKTTALYVISMYVSFAQDVFGVC